MDQLVLRRSLRSAAAAVQPRVPELDSDDEPAPVASRGSYGKKKRAAEAAAAAPADVPPPKPLMKRARRALNDGMTSAGQRADLSKHALGHLLVASPAVLDMLSTRDARHLRRADKALRSIVAEHPWTDIVTPVHRLVAEWRASFPAATACNVRMPSLTKAAAPLLVGLTSFICEGTNFPKADYEGPLSVVRIMPRLTVLHAGKSAVELDAPVWREISGLRELQLKVWPSPPTINLLSFLGSLRKLHLFARRGSGLSGITLSPGLAAVPLLESLSLGGDISIEGPDLAHLTNLIALTVTRLILPPGIFAHVTPSLRALNIDSCDGVTNATFASPALASLRELSLSLQDGEAVTSDALAGLGSLENLRMSGFLNLMSLKALGVLGSFGRLRRLSCSSVGALGDLQGFAALEHCPVTELDLSESASVQQVLTSSQIAHLPASLRSLKYSGAVTGIEPWSSLVRIVALDLSGSSNVFGAGCFSNLAELRALGLSDCVNVRRDALTTLPAGVTSLDLRYCKHLEVDDELLVGLGAVLPGLSYLSLMQALVSEVDPIFDDPMVAEQRLKTPEQVKRHNLSLAKKKKEAKEDEDDGESNDGDAGAGGSGDESDGDGSGGGGGGGAASAPPARARLTAKELRRFKYAERFGYLGEPPHTSVAGWTALMRAPRGFFSLDVRGNDLSYDSYALLCLHVAELRASKVKSPEKAAEAAERRDSAAAKREEKKRRAVEAAKAAGGSAWAAAL